MFRRLHRKHQTPRRSLGTRRPLRLEQVEGRVLLSGDGLIDLGQLFASYDLDVSQDAAYPSYVLTSGIRFDFNVADEVIGSSSGLILRYTDGLGRGQAFELPAVTNGQGNLSSDVELNLIRTFLPPEPFKPIEHETPVASRPGPRLLVAMDAMLRQEGGGVASSMAPFVQAGSAMAAMHSEALPLEFHRERQGPAESGQPRSLIDSPLPEEGDASRLERTWSFEVAALSEANSAFESLAPLPTESTDANEVPSASAWVDLSPSFFPPDLKAEHDASGFKDRLATSKAPTSLEGGAGDKDELGPRQAAFAGWIGSSRPHYQVGVALAAVLAASRVRAGQRATESEETVQEPPSSKTRRRLAAGG